MIIRDAHQLNECSSLNESVSNLINVLASSAIALKPVATAPGTDDFVVITNPFVVEGRLCVLALALNHKRSLVLLLMRVWVVS